MLQVEDLCKDTVSYSTSTVLVYKQWSAISGRLVLFLGAVFSAAYLNGARN